ncbi:hypothetical protein JNUCC1_02499 [Lentibacillus sp. JNUCC-1]|uniref:C45 family autoproteolytic acyltransferase/hydolase n=1 Tax=Lentibacillus sp. JNUCC-1 TaxID=2654513 RepID=UPI0012E72795|nr:C45 family peptidase [Lentibacillus sp. JNUCC-1]MUV38645.1 hypothetical protein [Lentibacillus sp. JNUCC-1]
MKQIYSDVIQFRGSHYDFGYKQGELLRNSRLMTNREKQWRTRRPRFEIKPDETKAAFEQFAPQIWDELIGLRDALELPLHDVLQEFSGYRTEITKSGCSVVTGTDYMVRNYDYHPKTYEGRFVMYAPNDGGYAVIGPSQRITGRMDGMNEKGLVMAYNFVHRRQPGDGFICSAIGRLVLERCATVDEAVDMLQEIPHRHSFSYTVFDRSGQAYVVEATPRDTSVRTAYACTNHFEELRHENRHHLDDSFKRMKAIEQQSDGGLEAYEAFRLMNDRNRGVFSDQYKNWSGTIHTSVYLPSAGKVWFALGGDREPLVFDFKTWLEGKNILTKRITGEVDTDLPFGHMDRNAR